LMIPNQQCIITYNISKNKYKLLIVQATNNKYINKVQKLATY